MNLIRTIAQSLTGPIGSILSAVLSIICALVFAHYAPDHSNESFNILSTVVIGVMVFLLFDSFLMSTDLGSLKDQIKNHDYEIKRHEEALQKSIDEHSENVSAFFADFQPKLDAYMLHGKVGSQSINGILRLANKDEIIRIVGMKRIEAYLGDFYVPSTEDYILFQSAASTLDSFVDFWDLMVDLQKKQIDGDSIIILSTHVNEISFYSAQDADITAKLLDRQTQFVNYGGKVFRMLIGKEMSKRDETASEYLSVVNKMKNRGIQVAYFNLFHALDTGLRETSDDILLTLPMKHSIKWTRSSAGNLRECCISKREKDFDDQRRIWNSLFNSLEAYEYADDPKTQPEMVKFQTVRDDFVKNFREHVADLL